MMTPEAMWAMGRIGATEASPNGDKVVYQVGYYSVKQNKSHQVLCIMDANGANNKQLTTSSKSETDPTWLDAETIAFISGGEIWTMKADGSERKQLSKTDGKVEGFKFSPDRSKVIILKSLPFHEIIKKNPADLPKATGRRVTDPALSSWHGAMTPSRLPIPVARRRDWSTASLQILISSCITWIPRPHVTSANPQAT